MQNAPFPTSDGQHCYACRFLANTVLHYTLVHARVTQTAISDAQARPPVLVGYFNAGALLDGDAIFLPSDSKCGIFSHDTTAERHSLACDYCFVGQRWPYSSCANREIEIAF